MGEVEPVCRCEPAGEIPSAARDPVLKPRETIGIYEVVCSLGAGGMGEVYRARDTKLQRVVVLKILPDAVARDAHRMARFEREWY
jgi:serine/threonine protein kinase